jgi:ABC-type multidrug transport system ATPase subunit
MSVFNLCPERFYCPNATAKVPCPGGHLCLSGFPRAIECRERGLYCTEGLLEPCPAGFYCPLGTLAPILCPAGYYCRALSFEPRRCVDFKDACEEGSATPQEATYQLLAFAVVLLLSLGPQAYSLTRKRVLVEKDKTGEVQRKEELVSRIVGHFTGRNAHQTDLKGLSHHDPPISLSFSALTLELPDGRRLLDGITGNIPAAGLCAVMGPSGCGKSTLLQVLSGRVTEGVSGIISINGVESNIGEWPTGVGYVPQDDIVLETLTVRENIAYSAMLRLPRGTKAAVRNEIVDEVIHVMRLDLVQHAQVGDVGCRGLSGGQRKRVNIGLELASDCGVLFLDEPTSGLDASSSLDILASMKTLTALGVTIIAVIHQPRYQIFNMFDHLLLLAGGRLAFSGPSRATIPYFEMLGYASPPQINPADFLMDAVSKDQYGNSLVTLHSFRCLYALPTSRFLLFLLPCNTLVTLLLTRL